MSPLVSTMVIISIFQLLPRNRNGDNDLEHNNSGADQWYVAQTVKREMLENAEISAS